MASSGIEVVDLVLYSKEAFVGLNMGSEEDFYNLDFPENMAYEFFEGLEGVKSFKKVRFPLIDEHYFHYLEKFNLEDSDDIRMEYATSLSDEDCEKLWENAEMNLSLDWGILPLIFVNNDLKQMNRKDHLSKETIEKLKDEIINSFNNTTNEDGKNCFNIKKEDIYISPVLVDMEWFDCDENGKTVLSEEGEQIVDTAAGILQNDEEVKEDLSLSVQDIMPQEIIRFFGVFIMYKYKTPAILQKGYFEKMQDRRMDMPTLNVYKITKMLKKDISLPFEVMTEAITYPEYFEELVDELADIINEQSEIQETNVENLFKLSNGHIDTSKDTKKKKTKRNTDF
jgi:hypothetical protein